MRGQAAVEWIVIISVAMLLLAVMLSFSHDSYGFFLNSIKVGKAKAALNDLKNAADFVFGQGKDAKTRVYVTIPDSCNLTLRTLPGGEGQMQAVVYADGKEQYFDVYTDANLTGSLPSKAGSYCMDVECTGASVSITRSGGSC